MFRVSCVVLLCLYVVLLLCCLAFVTISLIQLSGVFAGWITEAFSFICCVVCWVKYILD